MAAGGILILLIGPAIFKGKATTDQVQHEIAPETQRMLGSPTAPVTLTCFSDFQCPYCRVAGQLLEAFEGEMRGKVRVVFKFFPLDQTCNPSGGRHPLGCKAALAAYCAGIQGRFWPFHDQIFANQETLHERDFLSFAQALGLDINAFARCVEDPGSMAGIRKDIDEGIRLGVSGTPSLFIDGRRYQGPLTVAALKDMIPQ
jgi:protein-disulfide isomerase